MFSKFLNKEKPRVYLGKLMVVPRGEFKKNDEWGLFKSEDLEVGIREKLDGIFSLPHLDSRQDEKKTDLGLEVVILNVQGGDFINANIEGMGFPILWRPKIEIASRLYNLESGKTHRSFKLKEKMPWSQYFSGLFSLRGILRHKPIFGVNELEPLLYQACAKLIQNMTKSI